MKYYIAPLEGITNYLYRNAHQQYFPGADKYFMPFLAINQNRKFGSRDMADIDLDNNRG